MERTFCVWLVAPQDATKNTVAHALFTSKDAKKAIRSFAQETFRNSAIPKTSVAEELVWWHAATCSEASVWNLVINYKLYANCLNHSVNDAKYLRYGLKCLKRWKIPLNFCLFWLNVCKKSSKPFQAPFKGVAHLSRHIKKKALSYNSYEVSLNLSHPAQHEQTSRSLMLRIVISADKPKWEREKRPSLRARRCGSISIEDCWPSKCPYFKRAHNIPSCTKKRE